MGRRKIWTRIFVGYMLISVFCTTALLSALLAWTNTYADYRTESETVQRLTSVAKSIDIQTNTAQEVINALYLDTDIRNMAEVGSVNADAEAVRRAVKQRSDSARSKQMEVYVSTMEHSLDSVIGATRTSSVLSFLKTEGFGSTTTMDIVNYFSTNTTDTYFRLMEESSTGALGSRLAIVERKFYNETPVYFFTFMDLNRFLPAQSTSETLMIVFDSLILASNNYSLGAPRKGMYALLERMGSFAAMEGKPNVEQGYSFAVCQSEVMRWYYVLALPHQFFSPLRLNLYLLCLAVVLLALGTCIAIGVLLRRYAYAPLAATVENLSAYTNARCDAEDKYICDAVQSLAQQVQAYQKENAEHIQRIYTEKLRYMLRGIKPSEEMRIELEKVFCAQKDGPYRVCVLEFSRYAQLADAFSEEMISEIRHQVTELILQQLGASVVAEPMLMDYKSFVVITTGVEMRILRAKLINVVATVEGSFEAELAGAVGDLCERLSDIGMSYASALKILETHYSLGSRNSIVTSEDIVVNMGGNGLFYPIDTERELIAEVIRCHDEEVAQILTELLDENFEKHALTKERLNSFAFSIASTVNRVAETLGKSTQEIFGEGNIVFLELKMCTDKLELRSKVYGMFNTLVEFVQKQTPDTERDISDLMLDYIHAHYNEDISLSDLSSAFSLSLSYTSTLFKEVTGENFKDYLNRYRIKRACDILLQEPGIKNTSLARRVGCNTVATLLRLFNKYVGVTPGQYGKKTEK